MGVAEGVCVGGEVTMTLFLSYDLGAAQRLRPASPRLNVVSVIELHCAEGLGARRDLVTRV